MGMIRVSASSIAKIELDGKYLLGLNKSRLAAGTELFTPFGGALEYEFPAKGFLLDIGAEFEKGRDLRLKLPEGKLAIFESWFNSRGDREVSPYRELREELVDEERILPNMPFVAADLEYLTTKKLRGVSDRPGQEGMKTQWYFDVFSAKFTPGYEHYLRKAVNEGHPHVGLFSYEEIMDDREKFGDNSRCLF